MLSAECLPFCSSLSALTHLPLVLHICVSESGQHWFRWWLVTYSAPSHYLNQWWVIRTKLQWNLNQNHSRTCIWKYRLQNGGHFVQGEMSYHVPHVEINSNRNRQQRSKRNVFHDFNTFYFCPIRYWPLPLCRQLIPREPARNFSDMIVLRCLSCNVLWEIRSVLYW